MSHHRGGLAHVAGGLRARRAGYTILLVAGLFGASNLQGCNPPPGVGNLELRFGSTVDFDAVVAQDPAAFNEAQLGLAPYAPLDSTVDNVSYSDGFSTDASQTEILVMARDPAEQESTLESLSSIEMQDWQLQTVGPGDPLLGQGLTLPNAVSIPFPVTPEVCSRGIACHPGTPQSDWPLSLGQFTGSDSVPLGGNAASRPGPKGAYLLQRGVCAYDVDLQKKVVDAMTSTVPYKVKQGILNSTLGVFNVESNVLVSLGAASFIDRINVARPFGGVVTQLTAEVDYQAVLNPAFIGLNETYTFGLTNGILSVTPAQNGEHDTGAFSGSIASNLTSSLPQQIANSVYVGALAQQAQPIPAPAPASSDGGPGPTPPECQGSGPWPSTCFRPCINLPSTFPPKLDESNTDDSSWYQTQYCAPGAQMLVDAATVGAASYPLQGMGIGDVPLILWSTTRDGGSFNHVRCNFYPTYETDATPVPVCEIVVRAKRINVMPDQVELVWFDGPDLDHIGTSEYGNEAFALFLALRGANSSTSVLCNRTEEINVLTRRFAHGFGTTY